jgi:Fur family zinc uptake transcriptional regulator
MTGRSLQSAEQLCHDKGLAFTTLRRQVYELIAAEPTPVGAYDLLDRLRLQRGNAAPVTIYRALEFLLDAGLIHRIDALQAYAACEIHDHPAQESSDRAAQADRTSRAEHASGASHASGANHAGLVLVCSRCKHLTEFSDPTLERRIGRAALAHGFRVARHLVEIRGLCSHCSAG